MHIHRNKLVCCLAVVLLSSPVTVSAEEEIQIISETEETEETFIPPSEETDPKADENIEGDANIAESETQTLQAEKVQILDPQSPKTDSIEPPPVTVKNWEWNDQDDVVTDDTIDINCNNTGYILTYQNFSSCLPDSITSRETGDIGIQEWVCKELDLEPGTELLSLRKDSIHLLAVLEDSYTADPEPLLTIRFLKLTPAGKFTGNEKGIWKWVVQNN